MYACMCVSVYVFMSKLMYVCNEVTSTTACMGVCVYVCMCVCVHVYVCAKLCMYVMT